MSTRPAGYSRLRDYVTIDPANLDQEVINHPPFFLEVCEAAADAAEERDKTINDLDYQKAKLRHELREPREGQKKMTNDDIEAAIITDTKIGEYIDAVEKAKHNVALWNGLLEGYRTKASALKRLGELMHAGYSMSSSVLKTPREQIREASERRPRKDI